MIVQVYEVADPHEARLMADAGVDHVGVLVGQGAYPREIDHDQAREIFRALPGQTRGVALILSSDTLDILETVEAVQPDVLHLGTLPESLSPEAILQIRAACPGVEIMRSIPVQDESALLAASRFAGVSDYLLLDSHVPGDTQVGATGTTHDWGISRAIVLRERIPVLLAGGLGPDNVARAIEAVGPAGVDSKTGTDRAGTHRKDVRKVREFVRMARSCR